MEIPIIITIRADATLLAAAAKLISIGQQILNREATIMSTLQNVVDDVAAETTSIGSLSTFIQGLQDQIKALPGITPPMQSQIDGLFASVEANKASISAAMLIGVPPAPPPVVVPPVVPAPAI